MATQLQNPTEEQLKDFGLLHEIGGVWKYSYIDGKKLTANTKEGAIESAIEKYRYYQKKSPELLKTKEQRYEDENAEWFAAMHFTWGEKSIEELNATIKKIDKDIAKLEKASSREFNWNGGRRTSAAVAAEGMRQLAETKNKLVRYVNERIEANTPAHAPAPVAPAFELSAPVATELSATPAPAKKAPTQTPAERAEVMRASYAAAESFTLGGDPLANLTGQKAFLF